MNWPLSEVRALTEDEYATLIEMLNEEALEHQNQ